jgi:hypothetical protein
MPSYNYYADAEQREADWLERFPSWAFGYLQWVSQPPINDWRGPSIYDWLSEGIEAPPSPIKRMACPRLFVSHRKCDEKLALRIAWLASREGWDYWIDVLDPNLETLRRKENLARLSAEQQTLATAAIVEFALLNCSHLIAVMTNGTRGSMWVPYEYGRVKEPEPLTVQVSCWRHPCLKAEDCPEYVVLGKVHLNEDEIVQWLTWEMSIWKMKTGECSSGANANWMGSQPDNLPGSKATETVEYVRSLVSRTAPSNTVECQPGFVRIGDIVLPIRDYHA